MRYKQRSAGNLGARFAFTQALPISSLLFLLSFFLKCGGESGHQEAVGYYKMAIR
jgi:hypothetical protein